MNILRLFVYGMFLSTAWNEEVTLPEIQQGTVCLSCKNSSTVEITCEENEIIGFKGIYYGGKNVRSCQIGTKFDCQISTPDCCIPNRKRDCITTVETKGYYESCIGLESCSITFADDTMVCSTDSKPNYAGISYYCIPETNFVHLEQDSISNGKVVYLINNDYPATLGAFTTFTCSVETKCGTKLAINALDIYLAYDDSKGECIHELTIQDNGKFNEKTCFDNNQMRRSRYYYSDSNFITLSFTSTSSMAQCYVWLEFTELNLKESIEIICGKNAKRRSSSCQEDTTISTTMSYNSTNGTTLRKSTMPDDETSVKSIALSMLITILVVVGIIVGVCYYKKHKQSKISPNEIEVAPSTSESTVSETELSTPPRRVSTKHRLEDDDDESDDHSATESSTSYNWRIRNRGFVPPLMDYPSVPMRKNTTLPRIGEREGSRSGRVSLPQDIRRPLPMIASRTRRKIETSEK